MTEKDVLKKLAGIEGKNYVIIGTGGGIGSSVAHTLTAFGANVACIGKNGETAKKVAKEVGGIAISADMTRREEVQRAFDAAEDQLGPISGYVDVFSKTYNGALMETPDDAWDTCYNFITRNTYLAMQIGGEKIKKAGGGTMVHIGSIAGSIPYPEQGAYGSFKAGLNFLIQAAALELAPYNIRVNCVAPGFMRSPVLESWFTESNWEKIGTAIPLGRACWPEEIARTVLYLSSDLSAQVTGNVILADGGQSLTTKTVDIFNEMGISGVSAAGQGRKNTGV